MLNLLEKIINFYSYFLEMICQNNNDEEYDVIIDYDIEEGCEKKLI